MNEKETQPEKKINALPNKGQSNTGKPEAKKPFFTPAKPAMQKKPVALLPKQAKEQKPALEKPKQAGKPIGPGLNKMIIAVIGIAAVISIAFLLLPNEPGTDPTANGNENGLNGGNGAQEIQCELIGTECCIKGSSECTTDTAHCLEGFEEVIDCTQENGECIASARCAKIGAGESLEDKITDCQGHDSTAERRECLFKLAVEEENQEICENIQGDVSDEIQKQIAGCKTDVEIEFVVLGGEPEKCLELPDPSDFTCIKRIAVRQEDPSLCEKIPDFALHSNCYTDIALETGNYLICESITAGTQVQSCISKVAIALLDESICSNLEFATSRNDCYYKIAVRKSDASICAEIITEYIQKRCEKEVLGA